jgi:deazaflavin-dependent oxidoreductase (nitroreductase family)
MVEKISEPKIPSGFTRFLARSPIWLYRYGFGWLLGKRILLLTHTGRKSGLLRHTVLEVVSHDTETGTFYVASGWGERSDWLKNIMKTPGVRVQVGNRRFKGKAEKLSPEEAAQVLEDYAQRHPSAIRLLARFMGYHIEGSQGVREWSRFVPIVALRPIDPSQKIS